MRDQGSVFHPPSEGLASFSSSFCYHYFFLGIFVLCYFVLCCPGVSAAISFSISFVFFPKLVYRLSDPSEITDSQWPNRNTKYI